jgi:iduronate 2-sulfatase
MMKNFIYCVLVFAMIGCRACRAAALGGKTNVLFIAVDDLNVDLGSFGHPVVKTPHIDRLVARGVRFERAYCQFPLCSPSRESFLSGLRPETSGALAQGKLVRDLRPAAPYLPAHFRANGYFTAAAGKIFHKNDPAAWEKYENADPIAAQEIKALKNRAETRERGENGPEWVPLDVDDVETGDGIVARRTVEFLREAAKDSRPFFVAAGFRKPHLPWTAPRRYFDLYPRERIPSLQEPEMVGVPAIALQTDLHGAPKPEPVWQAVAAYYACVSFIDAQVGLLLAAMDELALWDQTVVVFIGDHGFHLGDHGGLWAKLTNFERSARVPLILVPPHSAATGQASRATIELLDLYPTLLELCRLSPPSGLEGDSFASLLLTPSGQWNHPAYTTTIHEGVIGRSVRTARWRYTEWGEGVAAELYDHDTDPDEYRNVAREARHQETARELKQLLQQTPRLSGAPPADAQKPRKFKAPK